MKENTKIIMACVITSAITFTGSVLATAMLQANSISYKTSNGDVTDVNSALDRLFDINTVNERIGNTDIGGKTITGAISDLKGNLKWKVMQVINGSDITEIQVPSDCSELYIDIFAGNTHFDVPIPINVLTESPQYFQAPGGYWTGPYQGYIRFWISKSQYYFDSSSGVIGGVTVGSNVVTTIYYR